MRRALLVVVFWCGCEGQLRGGDVIANPAPPTQPRPRGPGTTTPVEPIDVEDEEEVEEWLPPSESMAYGASRTSLGLRRLTRQEYINSVADLVGSTTGTANLTQDIPRAHFDNNAHGLAVALPTAQAFAASAEQLGVSAAASLSMPSGCNRDSLTTVCARTFLTGWLRRAFRRPATTDELTRYEALFTSLRATASSREALAGVIEASLLSAGFLYRSEGALSGRLDEYELASRLSYLVWNSTPDDALLDAARDGQLSTGSGRVAALRRLWNHPRAKLGMTTFARQWLGVQRVTISRKDSSVLQGTSPTLQRDLDAEFDLLVERQLMPESGSLEAFLAGKQTYVTKELAGLYGLRDVPTAGTSTVSLEGTNRRGVLTSGLLIAAHSKESGYSVPQFGAFYRKDVLCQPVPAPPVEAQNAVQPPPLPGESYRDLFNRFTGTATSCASCHTFLNPPGFAYLPFDPIGRHTAQDLEGKPFDTAVKFVGLDGRSPAVRDAAELAEKVSKSERAHACLTRMAIEYTMGRALHKDDAKLLDSVTASVMTGKSSLLHVVEAIVASEDFTKRGPTSL